MFVRTLDDLERLDRIKFPADGSFRSARFITADDGLGFSYNENKVQAGFDLEIWLKHHWEANYIVSGRGEVTDLSSDDVYPLEAGVLYVVGPNDRHRLRFTEDECHISVFCPPLTGNERFDEEGTYEASGPIEPTDRRMFARNVEEMRAGGREVVGAEGQVRTVRMLTAVDDVGFGLSDVRIAAGAEVILGNGKHRRANHVLSGSGEVTDLNSGERWELGAGVTFSVDSEDRCRVHAGTEMHLLSVMCPAIQGNALRRRDGAFF